MKKKLVPILLLFLVFVLSSTSFDHAEARNVKYEEFSVESEGSSSSSESTVEVCGTLPSGSLLTYDYPPDVVPPPLPWPPSTVAKSSGEHLLHGRCKHGALSPSPNPSPTA